MKITKFTPALLILLSVSYSPPGFPANETGTLKEDKLHINSWNTFADRLYKAHQLLIKNRKIYTTVTKGGYATEKHFYNEISYYDSKSKRLLSKIQWEKNNKKQIHSIEIFVYSQNGKLVRDYLAAWLPHHRNAPIQTLINLHYRDGELAAYRQFDASGNRIYEFCQGHHFGKPIDIRLWDDQLLSINGSKSATMTTSAYKSCFNDLSISSSPFMNPVNDPLLIAFVTGASPKNFPTLPSRSQALSRLTKNIAKSPKAAAHYIRRGQFYFKQFEFKLAVADYTTAIALDKTADEAWFGRGMALGRLGKAEAGIKDLGVYIARHPNSSLAYTKRGVRYIWIKRYKMAEKDLRKAIKLDAKNAEAHDDLGVLLSRRKDFKNAETHFLAAIRHDKSYYKAYHNLALVYHIKGQHKNALLAINTSLALFQNSKNSLMLKAVILKSLGKHQLAKQVATAAQALPDDNWSEVANLK